MVEKRLYRSRTDKVLTGVCAGIANYFGWDPTLVRVAWVVLSIVPGSVVGGIVVYAVMALVVPEEPPARDAPVVAAPPT